MILVTVVGLMSSGFTVLAQSADDKPSLAEANPFVIVLLVIGGLVSVVLSVLALRALFRASKYQEDM